MGQVPVAMEGEKVHAQAKKGDDQYQKAYEKPAESAVGSWDA
jgi:hypothetical protein